MTDYNCNPPGVVIPVEWLSVFEDMSRQQAGETILAILTYAATGVLPEFTDTVLPLIWPMIQARLDANRERYQKKVERSRAYKERQAAAELPAPRKTAQPRPASTGAYSPRTDRNAGMDKWL